MGDNNISDDNPLRPKLGDKIDRFGNNTDFMFWQLSKKIENLERQVSSYTEKTEILEESISHLVYVPTIPLKLAFDRSNNFLWLTKKLYVPFKKNEAELLAAIFMKNGRPSKKRFQMSELAEEFERDGSSMTEAKKIEKTAKRVLKRIKDEYNVGKIFHVDSKELYFYR